MSAHSEDPHVDDPHLPDTVWKGKHLSMARRGTWEYATRNTRRPAVGIVAVTDEGRVVLVEQHRPPVGESIVELPAGLAGDRPGEHDEALEEAARRELLEETGYQARDWRRLVEGYSSPGLTDESIVLFLATGLEKVGKGGGEGSESIEVREVPFDEVLAWLDRRGRHADLKLLAGLHAARPYWEKIKAV